MEITYYDNEPEKGGEKIPLHKHIKSTGLDKLFNPTHDFEKLKEFRLNQFESKKVILKKERDFEEIKTNENDFKIFYKLWLEHELEVIKMWLSDSYPNGIKKKIKNSKSNQVEIIKYKNFIENELFVNFDKHNMKTETSNIDNSIVHPFTITENFELFKFFIERWKEPNTERSKFTYFFDYFKAEKKEIFSQKQFFEFVSEFVKIKISNKRQANAINNSKNDYLQ